MVCSEGQPCKVSETPNTDFDVEFDKDEPVVSQPLEGTGTGIAGLAPFYDLTAISIRKIRVSLR